MDLNPFFVFIGQRKLLQDLARLPNLKKGSGNGFHEAMPAMRGYFFHEFPDELIRDPNKK